MFTEKIVKTGRVCAISIIQVNDNVLIVPEHASNSTFNREGVSKLCRTFTPEHVVTESSVVNPEHAGNGWIVYCFVLFPDELFSWFHW